MSKKNKEKKSKTAETPPVEQNGELEQLRAENEELRARLERIA